MRVSRWLFESYQRLNARERRVVAAGAVVSALALLTAWVVLPVAHRWSEREMAIELKQGELARLRALVAGEAEIRETLEAQQHHRLAVLARAVTGATSAVAASELQTLIQRYAEQSRVVLDRVDVVGEPKPAEHGLAAIPVQLSAQGDLYGLVDLLFYLQHGERLLVIDELRVSTGLATGGGESQRLSWTVRLHGPYLEE